MVGACAPSMGSADPEPADEDGQQHKHHPKPERLETRSSAAFESGHARDQECAKELRVALRTPRFRTCYTFEAPGIGLIAAPQCLLCLTFVGRFESRSFRQTANAFRKILSVASSAQLSRRNLCSLPLRFSRERTSGPRSLP